MVVARCMLCNKVTTTFYYVVHKDIDLSNPKREHKYGVMCSHCQFTSVGNQFDKCKGIGWLKDELILISNRGEVIR